MMTPDTDPGNETGYPPADPVRWPDVARVPVGPTARIRAAVATWLFRRAVATLDVRVEYPDGTVGGRPSENVQPRMIIRRPDAFARRVGVGGLIGFGEAFLAGDWTTDDLVGVLTPFAARAASLVPRPLQVVRRLTLPRHPDGEDNSSANSRANIGRHYDLSNDLFALFLDETLTYSSALFSAEELAAGPRWSDLATAQRRKIDELLDSAGVGSGTRVLEIGTGWGELTVRAAQRGADVTSITLSSEQRVVAQRRIEDAGLAAHARVDLLDYRALTGEYDAVVSVEMIEAVGRRYWPTYFSIIDRVLAPGGRVAIQAITMPHDRMRASTDTYTWIHKYVFPGGQLTSLRALDRVARHHTTLRMTAASPLGRHYAETLRLWRQRFVARRGELAELGFDHTFARMWEFYLSYSEAGFRAHYLDVYQLVFSRPGEVTR